MPLAKDQKASKMPFISSSLAKKYKTDLEREVLSLMRRKADDMYMVRRRIPGNERSEETLF